MKQDASGSKNKRKAGAAFLSKAFSLWQNLQEENRKFFT